MNNHFVSIIRRCELSYVRGEMEKYGLIPLEGRLIRILKDKSCSQDDLAEYLNLDKGRIAKNLASLEEKGLVCRRINAMKRPVCSGGCAGCHGARRGRGCAFPEGRRRM